MSDLLSQLEEQDRQHRLRMQQHNEEQERLRQDPRFIAESERRRTMEDQGWEQMIKCLGYAMRVKELAGDKNLYVDKFNRGQYSDIPQQIKVYKHNSDRRFEILYESSEKRLKVTCTSDIVYSLANIKTYTKQMYFAISELNENEMGTLMEWVLGKSNTHSKSPVPRHIGCTIAFLLVAFAIYLLTNSIWHWLKTIM